MSVLRHFPTGELYKILEENSGDESPEARANFQEAWDELVARGEIEGGDE